MVRGVLQNSRDLATVAQASHGKDFGDDLTNICKIYDEFDQSGLQLQVRMLPDFCSKNLIVISK